jgi:hypothetical protein
MAEEIPAIKCNMRIKYCHINSLFNSPHRGGGMKATTVTIFVVGLLSLGIASCATISSSQVASEPTAEAYTKTGSAKGVVILAINWGRAWGCGTYENAEILSFGFDHLPLKKLASDSPSEVLIDGPPRLMKKPVFIDYALLLDPGEYALTSFDIKVAHSVREVGGFRAKRSDLVENGEPKGGSFTVSAGEIIYIGNFFLDCHQQPMIWRYYTEGRERFKSHMSRVNQKYTFIDPDKVKYRLFRTTTLGLDYELPK